MKKIIALISFFLICTTNILLAHGKNDGIGLDCAPILGQSS